MAGKISSCLIDYLALTQPGIYLQSFLTITHLVNFHLSTPDVNCRVKSFIKVYRLNMTCSVLWNIFCAIIRGRSFRRYLS